MKHDHKRSNRSAETAAMKFIVNTERCVYCTEPSVYVNSGGMVVITYFIYSMGIFREGGGGIKRLWTGSGVGLGLLSNAEY